MNIEQFLQSTNADKLPEGLPNYIAALWYDAKGDWGMAHAQVDSASDKNCCWVHAYLHRKEGDIWNADYWYRRAGKPRATVTLNEEWRALASALL